MSERPPRIAREMRICDCSPVALILLRMPRRNGARLSASRGVMSLAEVLGSCRYPRQDSVIADFIGITLMPEMMDVTAPDPHDPVSQSSDTFAKVNFIAVIREIRIKSTQFPPQTTAYKKGESVSPRQVYHHGLWRGGR